MTDATHAYWRSTLERRFRLINDVASRLLLEAEYDPITGYALMSLAAARKRLAVITELSCLSFVRAWRTDIDTWREKLTNLPVLADLTDSANTSTSRSRQVRDIMTKTGEPAVDPTAQIASTAVIGSPFRPLLDGRQVHVERDTIIEAGVWIGQFAVVGHGVTIRRNSLIEDYVGIGPARWSGKVW